MDVRRTTEAVRIVESTASYRLGAFHNVSIAVWITDVTVPGVRAVNDVSLELQRRYGHSYSVNIVHGTVPLPSAEVRAESARAFDLASGRLRRIAGVLEGEGLWRSTMRGALTTISALTTKVMPMRFFRSDDEAAIWILDGDESAGFERFDLVCAIASVRRALR